MAAKRGENLGREKKVLIVEDNESCFILIREYLNLLGAKYIRARNGVEVSEVLKTNAIDLALVDLWLSNNESGIDITRLIKTISPDTPVIIQTAEASAENKEKCYDAGCDDYLVKPYTFKNFSKAVEINCSLNRHLHPHFNIFNSLSLN